MPQLLVIIASNRPGRVGLPVAQWFRDRAVAHGAFDIEVADLAEVDLPFMDEPKHPRLRQYVHDHTKRWSETVDAADAFVLVMPEYNYGFTAPLKNALDYLVQEWQHKPVGLVSYGGVAGGTRAAQLLKPVLVCLQMTPVSEAVVLPFVAKLLDEERRLQPGESAEQAADGMLSALARTEQALRPLRSA